MGIDRYQIIETDHFRKTVEKIAYQGLNVTIPYKEEAYHFCDELDESSQKTKVVNTLIGKKGYNTDYMALMDIFTSKTITFHHEKIVIIGNGATARSMDAAIHEVAKRNLATNYSITHVVRSLKGPLDVLLDKVDSLKDATILINATSYGTSPNYENEPLFSIDSWEQLKWVLDVVYNPLNTPLLQKARKKGIPTINGFQLLVLQASRSAQLMMGKSVDGEALYHKLLPDIQNIVLIGMPYSGKSHLGRELKKTYNRPLYDFDEILKDRGQDLPTLLSQGASIDDFRTFEKALALELADIRGAILVPGGGIVLSPESMRVLKRNAIIVYLETPMATLIERIDGTRPLVKSSKDLDHLAQERITYYERYADFSVQEEEGVINKIYENCYH
jgi:shikimate dehydrogenase